MESNYEDWNISEINYKNLKDRNKPLQIRYAVEIENLANTESERIYLNPILKHKIGENPFKLEQREYPVNFGYPIQINYTMILTLPINYTIEEKPKSTQITLPENGASYSYVIRQTANQVMIRFNFNINKSQFLPSEYEYLKAFYNQIIAKEKQVLVLKRIEPTAEK